MSRPAPALDPPVLAWLAGALPGHRIVAAAPLGGGYSNDNIRLTTDRGGYVLRRYRPGGGRDLARTCAVEAALAQRLAGTGVPVAEVIASDPDGRAAGEPLLLARFAPGVTVKDALAADPGSAAGLGAAAGRALAAVGAVTFARAGKFTGPDLVRGSPLGDIGNMLRFRADQPDGFAGAFIAGYRDAGGPLPPRWREISEALDLYALADFLTRPPGHRYFGKAVTLLKSRLERPAPG
jgi:aminoglycoside phosphotransferase (APT) family kinase protein